MAVSPWGGDGCLPARQLQPRHFFLSGCFWHPLLTPVPVWPACWAIWEGWPPRNSDASSRSLSGRQQSAIRWGCHVHPMLEQHGWKSQQDKSPVPAAVGTRACPCRVAGVSAQLLGPKPSFPTAPVTHLSDLLLSILLSVLSPLAFSPPSLLFPAYCPYLVRPYYLLLSAKASNL